MRVAAEAVELLLKSDVLRGGEAPDLARKKQLLDELRSLLTSARSVEP
jgi:hypothetical protein